MGYSGDWKEFTLSSHAPADAVTMEIRLTTEDAQGASVLFDGIRLKVPGLEGKYDFTGKKIDEGTGLTYFGARFYDPESCRFTTQDTYTNLPNDERGLENLNQLDKIIDNGLDKPIEQNPYVYCSDNPVGHFDSDGHMGREIAQAGESLEAAGPYGAVAAQVVMGIGAVVMLAEMACDAYKHATQRAGYRAGDRTPGGREFTKHGAERANERGFSDKAIDNIIDNNRKTREKGIDENGKVTWKYTDKRGNVVVTDEDGDAIVTAYHEGDDDQYVPSNKEKGSGGGGNGDNSGDK